MTSSAVSLVYRLRAFLSHRWCDLTLLSLFVGLLIVVTHFWVADRNTLLRTLFPLQAIISPASCSRNSPVWLQRLTDYVPKHMRALSNQVVWIDSKGQAFHCEMGWEGMPVVTSPVGKDSRFRYGSLTKPLVSAALMDLDRQGRLSLNTPLIQALAIDSSRSAPLDSRVSNIRLHHLLSHQVGMVGRLNQIFIHGGRPWCPHDLSQVLKVRLQFKPGSQTEYENINYCLAGEAIARSEGVPIREALDRLLSLHERGIQFVGEAYADDEVLRDFRNNPLYNAAFKGNFDYQAVSATAGLSGSALAYGQLMRQLIAQDFSGFLQSANAKTGCDSSVLRSCFGRAFFSFTSESDVHLSVKDGYLPGTSALVVVTPSKGVFVWLGNADIPGVVEGLPLRWLLNYIANHAV